MSQSKSSKSWLKEHFSDQFVKKAQHEGYRSRASFKLLEMDEKDKLLKPGISVVDLGAAPGGWSQVVSEKIGHQGKIFALDILPMDSLLGVTFIQGDFTSDSVYEKLMAEVGNEKINLVISDMAPNMSGNKSVDIPKSMALVELALDFALSVLAPGGCFLTKIFHGEGFDEVLKTLRCHFSKVVIRKPKASRDRSKEVYFLAQGFKKNK